MEVEVLLAVEDPHHELARDHRYRRGRQRLKGGDDREHGRRELAGRVRLDRVVGRRRVRRDPLAIDGEFDRVAPGADRLGVERLRRRAISLLLSAGTERTQLTYRPDCFFVSPAAIATRLPRHGATGNRRPRPGLRPGRGRAARAPPHAPSRHVPRGVARKNGERPRRAAPLRRLGGAIAAAAARHPDGDFLADEPAPSPSANGRRSNSLANAWLELAAGPGVGVGILARNHRGILDAVLAAGKLGARVVFLNTDFAGP